MSRCPLLADVATVPLTSPRLLYLDLSYCESLKALDVCSASLLELKLVACRSLVRLTADCALLGTLHLDNCEGLLAVELTAAVRNLDLPDSRGQLKCVELRNDSITSLSLHAFSAMHSLKLACASLLTLELGRCCALTDASVTALAAGCPLLRELSLEECEGISHLALSSLSLQKLNLAGCKAIVTATLECAALHVLVLEGCSALDDASITCAVRCLDLGTCRLLRKLHLDSDRCQTLLLKGCLCLAGAHLRCPALRALDLSFCADLADEALRALASISVQELNISRCGTVSNALIAQISEVFPKLQAINLSYLPVDDATLALLLRSPLELKVLELAACKELEFKALASMLGAGTLPAVETLDVSYTSACAQSVALWLELCPSLRSLKCNGCAHMAHAPPATAGTFEQAEAQGCALNSGALRCLSTHGSLRALSMVGCNELTRLEIAGSHTLADVNVRSCAALQTVRVDNCRALRSLSAHSCAELASVAVAGCAALDTLDLRNCPAEVDVQLETLPPAVRRRVLRQ